MSGGLAQQEALFSAPGVHDLIQTSEHAFSDPILQVRKLRQRGRNDLSKVTQPIQDRAVFTPQSDTVSNDCLPIMEASEQGKGLGVQNPMVL